MITTKDLMYGINRRIENKFKDIEINSMDITEGFARPSFSISLEDVKFENYNSKAKLSKTDFTIYYYPKDRHNNINENLNIIKDLEEFFVFNRLLEIDNQGNVEIKFKSLKIIDKVVVLRISIDIFQEYELPEIEKVENIRIGGI